MNSQVLVMAIKKHLLYYVITFRKGGSGKVKVG